VTTPRTVSGQAAISALRPHLKRALAPTILAIEAEAVAPYLAALREADEVLADLVGPDGALPWDEAARADLVARARAARGLTAPLLAQPGEALTSG
jgi:hypothetical protein